MPGTAAIGAASIPNQMLVTAGAGLLVTAFFVLFLLKSRTGLVTRALSQDLEGAQLMGVNVERIYGLAMILSVIPPTIAILVIAPIWSLDPGLGWPLLQTAILVAILGGLGNLRGTILAAFIVGFIAAGVSFFINPRLMGLATLVTVLLVLIFKPEGITRSESLW